jgi:hypothetical protein
MGKEKLEYKNISLITLFPWIILSYFAMIAMVKRTYITPLTSNAKKPINQKNTCTTATK